MVSTYLVMAILIIALLQLTMPILGQMDKTEALSSIAKPFLSPIEEKLLDALFHSGKDGYYAFQGRSYYREANNCYYNGNYDLALAKIDKSIEYYKKFEMLNDFIIMEDLYQKALSEVYTLKAAILFELGQFDESIIYSSEAIKSDPNNMYAWNIKGNALCHLGSYDEAIRCYDSAIGIDPYFTVASNNKYNCLMAKEWSPEQGTGNCKYVNTPMGRMQVCQGGEGSTGGIGIGGTGIGGIGSIGGINNIGADIEPILKL